MVWLQGTSFELAEIINATIVSHIRSGILAALGGLAAAKALLPWSLIRLEPYGKFFLLQRLISASSQTSLPPCFLLVAAD